VLAALGAGADGYALKDQPATELLNACRAVLAGQRYLSLQIAGMAGISAPPGREEAREMGGPGPDKLSPREREVLKLVAEGRRTREIASHLFISPRTVERHRATLMKKLHRHTISALTLYAIDHGLLPR
jgi:DNA-binding NarL/FixJ family response regulator